MKSAAAHVPPMASVRTALRHRVDPAPATAVLALGDLVCIAVFVVVGAIEGHGFDPAAQAPRLASTTGTFVLGWALLAIPAGVYADGVRRSLGQAALRIVPAWAGAALVAQGLRALEAVPGRPALTFYLVSVAVGLALLLGWRAVVAVATTRR